MEVVSEGGVFWWRCQNDVQLTEVWDDLILLLQTMEEKQVQKGYQQLSGSTIYGAGPHC